MSHCTGAGAFRSVQRLLTWKRIALAILAAVVLGTAPAAFAAGPYTVTTPLPAQRNVLRPNNTEAGQPDDPYKRSAAWATYNSSATPWSPNPTQSWLEPQRFIQHNQEYWVLWS